MAVRGARCGAPRPSYRCPDLPGINPRLGTSFWTCGPLAAFRSAGSNPRPLAFANGFNPASAGFPVFVFGMICPCLGIAVGRYPATERRSGRCCVVHCQGTPWCRAASGPSGPASGPRGGVRLACPSRCTPLPRLPVCHKPAPATTASRPSIGVTWPPAGPGARLSPYISQGGAFGTNPARDWAARSDRQA